jgi:hypothetical protein
MHRKTSFSGIAFFFALVVVDASFTVAEEAPRAGCGTFRLFQAPRIAAGSPGARIAKAAEGTALSGRKMVTTHFAIHYTMGRTTHRPAYKTGDAADTKLKAQVDSLSENHAATSPTRRDSLINASLDALEASHPAFIQRVAAYLENAYTYDRDTLGMRVPDSNVTAFYRGSVAGKFNVEVGDIDALQSGYEETYGLTFPPELTGTPPYFSTALLIENDFLYNASVNTGNGVITGTPIKVSRTDSTGMKILLHDYSVDWDQGLAVTIAHEFYHAVQFLYTPIQGGYHAWYELTAVGMEERLAPTVNDYLGYLPSVLTTNSPVYLLTPPGSNINYGNGIFHTFLTKALGKTFDAGIWQTLSTNNNSLPAALVQAAGSAARWDSLFAVYTASLAIAGRPGAAASPLAFSPDFSIWPRPRVDTGATTGSTYTLSSLTYRLVAPVPSAMTYAATAGLQAMWRVSQTGTSFSSQRLTDSLVPILPNGTLALAVANASFTTSGTLTLKRAAFPVEVAAFPNPATRAAGTIHFAAPYSGSTAVLTVLSESGRPLATLNPDPTGSFWTWNFRDSQNRIPPAGVYYYGIPGAAPQTLLVLP